jgi:acyl-CoA synthetase (AMP-forming)/AMP-acid ligase II
VQAELPQLKRVIVTTIDDMLPFPARALVRHAQRKEPDWVEVTPDATTFRFADLLAWFPPAPPWVDRDPSDVALFQYTGGTTGVPKAGSIGIPVSDVEARIVDLETGEPIQAGTDKTGELLVRGPQVMKGYWNQPDETAQTLDAEGWLHTGDIARVDEDGYFSIVDRKKDMIIASGYKIFPCEVEEVLFAHPKVREVAVAGVPDRYRGETVKAYIIPVEGTDPSAEEIIAYCRENLAPYKVPRLVEFREELPKTMIGKVLRRALVEEERQRQLAEPISGPSMAPSTEEAEVPVRGDSATDAQEVAR